MIPKEADESWLEIFEKLPQYWKVSIENTHLIDELARFGNVQDTYLISVAPNGRYEKELTLTRMIEFALHPDVIFIRPCKISRDEERRVNAFIEKIETTREKIITLDADNGYKSYLEESIAFLTYHRDLVDQDLSEAFTRANLFINMCELPYRAAYRVAAELSRNLGRRLTYMDLARSQEYMKLAQSDVQVSVDKIVGTIPIVGARKVLDEKLRKMC